MNESISEAFLFDETVHQKLKDESSFANVLIYNGFISEIKVDGGTVAMARYPDSVYCAANQNEYNIEKEKK